MDKYKVLKEIFGYTTFREGQETLIDTALNGRDVLGIMPTGAGKSMCFQIPALLFDGITIVISPLISLMNDQVRALNEAGIHAAYINSSLSENQIYKAMENARQGKYKIIYVAPERLLTDSFLSLVEAVQISMITVDEAHCISQWGQDFRPSYLRIPEFISRFQKRPIITAFTATATKVVKEDIQNRLQLENPEIVLTGYNRENLFFSVKTPQNKKKELLQYLKENPEKCGIIYCNTRKMVEEVQEELVRNGYPAVRYHAGLTERERNENQNKFIYEDAGIMVATNAFGMGIDKSNVRFVIHFNMPKDIESYYQEAGRAGRDGLESECILYYSGQDVRINEFLINMDKDNETLTEEEKLVVQQRERERLKKMTIYCITNDCLRNYILKYFGEYGSVYCGKCANCLTEFEEVDVTKEAGIVIRLIDDMGERFGVNLVVDTACGSENDNVRKCRLHYNTFYGALQGYNKNKLKQIINELVIRDFLYVGGDKYPILMLGPEAKNWLRKNSVKEAFIIKLPKENILHKKQENIKQKGVKSAQNSTLFEQLRSLRMQIARQEHVPPYIVFSDKTLNEMCAYMPDTEEKMLQINGVGKNKYEKYGVQFEQLIREYGR